MAGRLICPRISEVLMPDLLSGINFVKSILVEKQLFKFVSATRKDNYFAIYVHNKLPYIKLLVEVEINFGGYEGSGIDICLEYKGIAIPGAIRIEGGFDEIEENSDFHSYKYRNCKIRNIANVHRLLKQFPELIIFSKNLGSSEIILDCLCLAHGVTRNKHGAIDTPSNIDRATMAVANKYKSYKQYILKSFKYKTPFTTEAAFFKELKHKIKEEHDYKFDLTTQYSVKTKSKNYRLDFLLVARENPNRALVIEHDGAYHKTKHQRNKDSTRDKLIFAKLSRKYVEGVRICRVPEGSESYFFDSLPQYIKQLTTNEDLHTYSSFPDIEYNDTGL